MLKKFDQFITISLAIVLIWMSLTCSYSNAQGSMNFFCVQFNGGIQINIQMSVAAQTASDKMLKFLERVKLEVASITANLKTALVRKPTQNKSALMLTFDLKCQISRKRNVQFSCNFQKNTFWPHLHVTRHQNQKQNSELGSIWRILHSNPLLPEIYGMVT